MNIKRNKKVIVGFMLATVGILLALGVPSTVKAETATCESVVVTAEPGTRVIVGLDSEPPYQVNEGETKEFFFFQMSNDATTTHSYMLDVHDLITDAQIGFVKHEVTECGTIPFPVTAGSAEPPIAHLGDPQMPAPVYYSPSKVFPGLELAPPW